GRLPVRDEPGPAALALQVDEGPGGPRARGAAVPPRRRDLRAAGRREGGGRRAGAPRPVRPAPGGAAPDRRAARAAAGGLSLPARRRPAAARVGARILRAAHVPRPADARAPRAGR